MVLNAKQMAKAWQDKGFTVISGEPACHMFLVSLSKCDLDGHQAQELLESLGVICNKNSIPNDPLPPQRTSGLRLGMSAMTTLGMDAQQAYDLGQHCADALLDTHKQSDLAIFVKQLLSSLRES